ncbi:MAG: hypothetical protein AB7I01_20505 [Gammaproteobacteria bacterium]
MTFSLSRLALVALLSTAAATSQAAVLGTVDFEQVYTLPVGPGSEPPPPPAFLILRLGYSGTVGGLEDPTTSIFEHLQILDGSAPFTVTLSSAADDPEYPAYLALGTNGQNDEVRFSVIGNEGGGGGYSDLESSFTAPLPGVPGPDLVGFTITGIELFVAHVSINPTAGFGEEAWRISGQIRVLGDAPATVPLPGAAWLLAGALPLLARRRRAADVSPARA